MGGDDQDVIELSIEETNVLRAKLGLKPLNVSVGGGSLNDGGISGGSEEVDSNCGNGDGEQKERLEMSIDETNKLRAQLGLAPLRTSTKDSKEETTTPEEVQDGTSARKALHKPATNLGEQKDIQERMERAKLERQVQSGIQTTFDEKGLGEEDDNDDGGGALSWVEKLKASKQQQQQDENGTNKVTTKSKKKKKGKKKKEAVSSNLEQSYNEQDLEGMNVGHSMSELEAGSTTILTLADAPLLKTQTDQPSKVMGLNEDDSKTLQNVELAEQQAVSDGLRQKRQVELGLGRAGGYAGFDDDEFEELGGTQGPSRVARSSGGESNISNGQSAGVKPTRGFRIGGSNTTGGAMTDNQNDLFAFQQGKAISLEPTQMDITASDFMTAEEDELLNPNKKSKKKDKKVKKSKKDATFKKKKKKDKKEKKHRRRQKDVDSDDDGEEGLGEESSKGLLETLEETAVEHHSSNGGTKRKRRRSDSDDEGNDEHLNNDDSKRKAVAAEEKDEVITAMQKEPEEASKRAKFEKIMAKGNLRTATAFKDTTTTTSTPEIDEEPDDAFLNAALAKARRLRKLKEMSGASGSATAVKTTNGGAADAIVQALQTARTVQNSDTEMSTSEGGITFDANDTREFTRALHARKEQEERKEARRKEISQTGNIISTRQQQNSEGGVNNNEEDMAVEEEPADMVELAKEIKEDDEPQMGGFDGTASTAVAPIGRGLANALSMLRHTGEISGKNAGKEELRGRAKDERHYENYEKLDLDKVVKIGRNATDKDREFANREIKLEYRDEHGRLLTTKEAYRNLCYQFHGHGSSQKNEERRLRQIERERAEARLASRQVADDGTSRGAGTLGALKATQRATGKAFVVHKT